MQSVRLRKWSAGTRLLAVLSVLVMAAMPAGILPAKADSLSVRRKSSPSCRSVRNSWTRISRIPAAT